MGLFLKKILINTDTAANNLYYMKRNRSIERKTTLFREVNSKVRYYKLEITMNLFGEYLLIRENGNVKNKKPTRIVKEYYKHEHEALLSYKAIMKEKFKRGYQLKMSKHHSYTRRFRDVQSRQSAI